MNSSRLFVSTLASACLIGSALSLPARSAETATIQAVGWFDDGNPASRAFGISADGTVVVGESQTNNDDHNAFRWTAAGGIQNLGTIGDVPGVSYANAVSANGSVVVGRSMTASNGSRAFRWTQAGGMVELGTIGDVSGQSNSLGVSANGSVVVGYSPSPVSSGEFRAFRWTTGGMAELGTIGGVSGASVASGLSPVGDVVVGTSKSPSGKDRAFRWSSGGIQELGTIGNFNGSSYANAVSADGSVVVGESSTASGSNRAFRWTSAGMKDLGTVGNVAGRSLARGVSPDGKVIVGETFQGACVWIDGKPRLLWDLLEAYGADPGDAGWTSLISISGCSADGTKLCGDGLLSDGSQIGFHAKIFVDREKPKFVQGDDVRTFCDPGKIFATVKLPKPKFTDNAPGKVTITNDAKSTFEIGTTKVVWSATDVAGNVAIWTQTVTVVNRAPQADAGKSVTVTTNSEKGVRVKLDGSASSDPDKHALAFAWSVPGVKLAPAKSAKPSGVFPVGTKTVKLTVTDAGGAKDIATARVTVRLKNGTPRPRGAQANAAFADAARSAGAALSGNSTDARSLSAFAYAGVASSLGDAAGEFVRWQDGQSPADAELSYAELRSLQQAYGSAAAQSLFSAYAETGDANLLSAYVQAAWGAAFAAADLSEP